MEKKRRMALFDVDLKGMILWYLMLTKPLHNLRDQAIKVLTALIYSYHMTDSTLDEIDRWAEVFSYDNKLLIRKSLNDMSEFSLNNQLSILRKKGAIKNKRVAPSFNLPIDLNTETFDMILRFNITK